jgi:hypothetical protein
VDTGAALLVVQRASRRRPAHDGDRLPPGAPPAAGPGAGSASMSTVPRGPRWTDQSCGSTRAQSACVVNNRCPTHRVQVERHQFGPTHGQGRAHRRRVAAWVHGHGSRRRRPKPYPRGVRRAVGLGHVYRHGGAGGKMLTLIPDPVEGPADVVVARLPKGHRVPQRLQRAPGEQQHGPITGPASTG